MLAHPTLDQLNALGLHGLAKGFRELEHKPEARGLDHAEWLGLLLEYELTLPDRSSLKHGPGPPSCAIPPASRTSIIRHPAASTARCSSSSRPVIGSPSGAISS